MLSDCLFALCSFTPTLYYDPQLTSEQMAQRSECKVEKNCMSIQWGSYSVNNGDNKLAIKDPGVLKWVNIPLNFK